MLHRVKRLGAGAGLVTAAVLQLGACSSLDALVFGPPPDPSTRPISVAPLDGDAAYPSVATVPAKPQLSYSVQQQRSIVDALVSDRENARYTGELIRHRSGLRADAPPPPSGVTLRGEDVVGAGADGTTPPEMIRFGLEEDGATSDDGARTLPPDQAQLDDGSLDDFIRELVDETEANPEIGTQAALIRRESAPIPGQKGTESAFERLFVWIGEQLGAGASAEGGTSGEAADQRAEETPAGEQSPPGEEPEVQQPAPAAPRAGTPPVPVPGEGSPADAVPELKPDESADPPEPAPAKPADDEPARPAASPVDPGAA